jgi:hypothetical protein
MVYAITEDKLYFKVSHEVVTGTPQEYKNSLLELVLTDRAYLQTYSSSSFTYELSPCTQNPDCPMIMTPKNSFSDSTREWCY